MIGTKPHKNYINVEPLERIIKIPYDPRDDLRRVEHSLDWYLNAKPFFNFNVNSQETAARVDSWYEARTGEITRAEQSFRQRLEAARKAGTLDESDYMRAIMDLQSPMSHFGKARQEALEIYQKERKFV